MFTIDPRQAAKVAIPDTGQKTLFLDQLDSILKTKDDAGAVEALATVDATEPKVYVALLTQTGTDAPVATILKNTLDGVPVWTRDTFGVYNITLANAFTPNKTAVFVAAAYDTSNGIPVAVVARISNGDTNYFPIYIIGDGITGDDMLNTTLIKIEVYP